MDNKVLGGVLIIFVMVVGVAGVMFFNSTNPNTLGVINPIVSTNNQTMENNTTNTNNNFLSSSNSALTVIPFSTGYNGRSAPTPSPSPTPGPDPIPDPMNRIITLFDDYLTSNYDQSLMPGMAVVIVQDGKIIYMKTLGVKDLASGEPVDKNTLFGICSISKQFTSTNIAQLVDKGLMGWDDPIANYYSVPDEFLLYSDFYVSNNITIRDVLMHNSGLSRELGNEYPTYFNDSFSEAIFKLRYVENATSFRSTYAYNSLIYALAGYSAAQANNTTWDELIKKDILDPLGMTTTTTSYWDFLNSPNHATPYKLLKNGTMVPYDIIPDPVGPA
ncbi:MAG: beta-lactamase family protein, partial [Methanobacteriaceae archaeon]|nr:beta-lactamase family protein [Methanobacteriaceae archaeon]